MDRCSSADANSSANAISLVSAHASRRLELLAHGRPSARVA